MRRGKIRVWDGVIRRRGVRCTGSDKSKEQREGLVFIYLHRSKTLGSAVLKGMNHPLCEVGGSHITLVSHHGARVPYQDNIKRRPGLRLRCGIKVSAPRHGLTADPIAAGGRAIQLRRSQKRTVNSITNRSVTGLPVGGAAGHSAGRYEVCNYCMISFSFKPGAQVLTCSFPGAARRRSMWVPHGIGAGANGGSRGAQQSSSKTIIRLHVRSSIMTLPCLRSHLEPKGSSGQFRVRRGRKRGYVSAIEGCMTCLGPPLSIRPCHRAPGRFLSIKFEVEHMPLRNFAAYSVAICETPCTERDVIAMSQLVDLKSKE